MRSRPTDDDQCAPAIGFCRTMEPSEINALLNEMSVETVEANIEVKQSVSPQNELQIEQFCDRFFQQYCD